MYRVSWTRCNGNRMPSPWSIIATSYLALCMTQSPCHWSMISLTRPRHSTNGIAQPVLASPIWTSRTRSVAGLKPVVSVSNASIPSRPRSSDSHVFSASASSSDCTRLSWTSPSPRPIPCHPDPLVLQVRERVDLLPLEPFESAPRLEVHDARESRVRDELRAVEARNAGRVDRAELALRPVADHESVRLRVK